MAVIKAEINFYGQARCCKCGEILGDHTIFKTPAIVYSLESDLEEGMEWRAFCKTCDKSLAGLTNEQVYNMYDAALDA